MVTKLKFIEEIMSGVRDEAEIRVSYSVLSRLRALLDVPSRRLEAAVVFPIMSALG
jgi:hypothetical protein